MRDVTTEINGREFPKGTSIGLCIPYGRLFRDKDGDFYLRMAYGALMITAKYGPECPRFYNEDDLRTMPFFDECSVVDGHITITVDIQ